MQDYYETLQVHPKAEPETIEAAYLRLRERYDPAKLEAAADEIQALARQRRDEIEQAYAVLRDPQRREAYDHERSQRQHELPEGDDDAIDYRPLPPAGRRERPEGFDAQPKGRPSRPLQAHKGRQAKRSASGLPVWVVPSLIVGLATFGIVMTTLVITLLNSNNTITPAAGPQGFESLTTPTAVATPSLDTVMAQFEGQVVAARQVAERVPENFNAWIELGNALYDSVVVVRERLARSDPTARQAYIERLPRWLEAADAYAKAAEIDPQSALAYADMAASFCYYGQDTSDMSYVEQGIAHAEKALELDATEGRALLSAGICYAFNEPPQITEALAQWQMLIVMPDAEPNLVFQARQLIQEYSR
ncbi:DnaJ domain-containing protein [Candidatus Chloroploca sp. M-50]|uniref:DnaJ domain-containing protein n=1 Tax=Candidatus Chloroploca mongolica TaxID=2528176 RepID=A0ABS4D7R8_9CHLR|nr:DnaJ domain-containing protein [Candidatus Chloroploca mongolica]MBP1465472.1 DnaJ domain-containing protein [Candidatus Chloroploca mongolica]